MLEISSCTLGQPDHHDRSSMAHEQRNLELMPTLDDLWNAQDRDTFDRRYPHDVVRLTIGAMRRNHRGELFV